MDELEGEDGRNPEGDGGGSVDPPPSPAKKKTGMRTQSLAHLTKKSPGGIF